MQLLHYISLVLVVLVASCAAPSENQERTVHTPEVGKVSQEGPALPEENVILFFGNSLTAGYGLELSEAFPALIQERLDGMGLSYDVRNSGVSGETTAGGKNRLEFVLGTLNQPLDIFVLELGANDGLRGIDLKETRKNLQEIINKVRSAYPEVKVILCGMEVPPNMGEDYIQEFRAIYPDLATLNQVELVPFLLDGVAGNPELNLPDGIHPTPEGHQIVADNVWEVMQSMIGRT
ncbi:MAG: arylesterase [Bacteroidota bacterium]